MASVETKVVDHCRQPTKRSAILALFFLAGLAHDAGLVVAQP
jgi:hypothetical protein